MSLYRVYHPYWDWECYVNGMWRRVDKSEYSKMLNDAIAFTGDHLKYGEAMQKVVLEWPKTMEHHLTNPSINKKAFIGHCAVCYKLSIPEYIVRDAWKRLTDRQRLLANLEADRSYKIWINEYKKKSRGLQETMEVQVLF